MGRNKILSKIENAEFKGFRKAGSIVGALFGTALFVCILQVICRWGDCFESYRNENVFLIGVSIYLCALLIYKHVVIKKLSAHQPKETYSQKLIGRLFFIYLIGSIIVSTVIEYFFVGQEGSWSLIWFAAAIGIINCVIERVYHYWGIIFYNSRCFILVLLFITIINFVIIHLIFDGILFVLAIAVILLICSLFAPKGMAVGINSNGGMSTYYYY